MGGSQRGWLVVAVVAGSHRHFGPRWWWYASHSLNQSSQASTTKPSTQPSAGKSKNNTIELISEKPLLGEKTWEICSIWSKQKVYWHEGFEMRLVFRMRVPDTTNNGGEGFALVWQQERPNFMGDLRNKGGRPNGQTYYPAGLGINALTRSFAIKFDNSPQTTDPSNKPHFSIHEAGDWVNPYPSSAFTDQIPAYNNGHDHILKIYYDIEDVPGEGRVGFMSFYWISEFEGENTWGTLDKPIFKTRVHFDRSRRNRHGLASQAL